MVRGISFLLLAVTLAACGGDSGGNAPQASRYVLGSVVIDADGNRTTYVQTVPSLDAGPFNNKTAIELPGNGVVMGAKGAFFVGLTEEPTWVRYGVDSKGVLAETGRLSFLDTGASAIDYGNAVVDDETAVSVFSNPPLAVVWNHKTMTKIGEIPLSGLMHEGYDLEVWTTAAHNGLVYIPGRFADWKGNRIYPGVSLTILDPKKMTVVATATDDRCASGGRVVFDAAGYAYVMGDGRTYSIQMFANAAGTPAPKNCLLRIAPGETQFQKDYYYAIPSLTGGPEAIGELETARDDSGVGFATMFHADKLPSDVKPVDFGFWDLPVHKLWRLNLADPPTAVEVSGIPFSTIGFTDSALDGHLYSGQSEDGSKTNVYEVDPATNTAKIRFTMDGYFDGLYDLAQ
jgi:hypothetical protein